MPAVLAWPTISLRVSYFTCQKHIESAVPTLLFKSDEIRSEQHSIGHLDTLSILILLMNEWLWAY